MKNEPCATGIEGIDECAVKLETKPEEQFIFRTLTCHTQKDEGAAAAGFSNDVREAIAIETVCFPPHEACSPASMEARMKAAPERFLAAIDKKSGKMAGFLNGITTDEAVFRDDFFTDAALHRKDGTYTMLLGLDVLPEYRRRGLGRELMRRYLEAERARGVREVVLTCLEDKVSMYERFGFTDKGMSASVWGGEQWHEMGIRLG